MAHGVEADGMFSLIMLAGQSKKKREKTEDGEDALVDENGKRVSAKKKEAARKDDIAEFDALFSTGDEFNAGGPILAGVPQAGDENPLAYLIFYTLVAPPI